jgi:ABC-type multidrug transport system ATPase subunit
MLLLSVRGLQKYYASEPVLSSVTFDLRAGERVSLVGPNGAGKTTLMRILIGDEEADAGEIEVYPPAQRSDISNNSPSSIPKRPSGRKPRMRSPMPSP